MAGISIKYPSGLKDEEILQLISEYQQGIVEKPDINGIMLYSPLITLGLNELQRRTTKKTHEATLELEKAIKKSIKESNKQARTANLQNNTTRKLTQLALLIAVLSFIGTVIFSYLDFVGDQKWQNEQINTLRSIETTLEQSRP